jgi:hypothetical protein
VSNFWAVSVIKRFTEEENEDPISVSQHVSIAVKQHPSSAKIAV